MKNEIQQMVNELLSSGLTQAELAIKADCSQPAISAYSKGRRGTESSYAIGKRLTALHKEICIDKTS